MADDNKEKFKQMYDEVPNAVSIGTQTQPTEQPVPQNPEQTVVPAGKDDVTDKTNGSAAAKKPEQTVVPVGKDDVTNRDKDPAVTQRPVARPGATHYVYGANLGDSPALEGQRAVGRAGYGYGLTDRRGNPRAPNWNEQQRMQEAARQERARASYEAFKTGAQQRQQRHMADIAGTLAGYQRQIAADNAKIRGGDFSNMDRISQQNWDAMGLADGSIVENYKKDANGNFVLESDGNGGWKKVLDGAVQRDGAKFDAEKNAGSIEALNDWSKNQWRTNFNGGVQFNRYDGGFDVSKLPKGLFRNGELDVSQIKSQRQFDALMHIMGQDQKATGAPTGRGFAARQEADADAELRKAGLDSSGMTRQEKLAVRDQIRYTRAERAVGTLASPDASAQDRLDAITAIRSLPRGKSARQIGQAALDARSADVTGEGVEQPEPVTDDTEASLRTSDERTRAGIEADIMRGAADVEAPDARLPVPESTLRPGTPEPFSPDPGEDIQPEWDDPDPEVRAAREREQVRENLADPNSDLSNAIRSFGPGRQEADPVLARTMAGIRESAPGVRANNGPSLVAGGNGGYARSPGTISALRRDGPRADYTLQQMDQAGGWNRNGLAAVAAIANPVAARAAYALGGISQLARGATTEVTEDTEDTEAMGDVIEGTAKIAGSMLGLRGSSGAASGVARPRTAVRTAIRQYEGGAMPGSKPTPKNTGRRLAARVDDGEGVRTADSFMNQPDVDAGAASARYADARESAARGRATRSEKAEQRAEAAFRSRVRKEAAAQREFDRKAEARERAYQDRFEQRGGELAAERNKAWSERAARDAEDREFKAAARRMRREFEKKAAQRPARRHN